MRLVEQHVIKQNDSRFTLIDEAAFKSKNLYNAANYVLRQAFIYRAANGQEINADLSGAYNIIRKVAPDAFVVKDVEDGEQNIFSVVVHPVRAVVPLTKPKNGRMSVKPNDQ